MLYQLLEFKNGVAEIREQKQIHSLDELHLFINELIENHSVHLSTHWMLCNEKNIEYFVWGVDTD